MAAPEVPPYKRAPCEWPLPGQAVGLSNTPHYPPDYAPDYKPKPQPKWWHPCVTARLSPLMLAMLKAAEEGSLQRRGWNVTIRGQRASVVTLHKLQQRGLVRLVRITDDGRRALEYVATGKIDGEAVWTSVPR